MSAAKIAADAAWYRDEQRRLEHDLATMTPGHRAAIGEYAYRRMCADADSFRQLADEHEAYLARIQSEPEPEPAVQEDDGGLF